MLEVDACLKRLCRPKPPPVRRVRWAHFVTRRRARCAVSDGPTLSPGGGTATVEPFLSIVHGVLDAASNSNLPQQRRDAGTVLL